MMTSTKIKFVLVFFAGFLIMSEFSCVMAADPGNQDDAPPAVLPQKKDDPALYRIGPKNIVQIKIFGDASTHQIYRVDETGYISHALIGKVKLAGLTTGEAEKMMESRLDKDYIINPRVNVFILQYSTFSIIGEVRKPGNYELTGRVSVIEAISMAGGFTAVANQKGVKIMRKKDGRESAISIDTTRITQQGDRSADAYIEEDDVLVVPKSFF